MTKSESIAKLATALAQFQGVMEAISKDSDNPFYKSKYASLGTIIEATREPLAKAGLSFVQFPEGAHALTTVLMHTSGEFIEATYEMIPVDNKPQSVGSALSYMRRYALSSILGLQVEDDDGQAASKPQKKSTSETWNQPRVVVPEYDEWNPDSFAEESQQPKRELTVPQQRARIYALLKTAGVDVTDKKACEVYVADNTQLQLTPVNYKSIINYLEK